MASNSTEGDDLGFFTKAYDVVMKLRYVNGRRLTPTAKLVFCRIRRNTIQRNYPVANKQEFLAFDLGIDPSVISKAIKILSQARLISIRRERRPSGSNGVGRYANSSYTFIPNQFLVDDAVARDWPATRRLKRANWDAEQEALTIEQLDARFKRISKICGGTLLNTRSRANSKSGEGSEIAISRTGHAAYHRAVNHYDNREGDAETQITENIRQPTNICLDDNEDDVPFAGDSEAEYF